MLGDGLRLPAFKVYVYVQVLGPKMGEIGKRNLGDFFPNLLLYFLGFLGFILFQNG